MARAHVSSLPLFPLYAPSLMRPEGLFFLVSDVLLFRFFIEVKGR